LSQVEDIHNVAFWTGPIRQSERQHIPRIHFTGVSVPILALQLKAGLEFCATSSQGSCYDRMSARGTLYGSKTEVHDVPPPYNKHMSERGEKLSVHTSLIRLMQSVVSYTKPLELL